MADEKALPEPRVDGIGRGEYQAWRHHPVTELVLKYLRDKQAEYQRIVLDKFIAGTIGLGDEKAQALRGQIIELSEIEQMPFEALLAFYKGDDEDGSGDDAARRD